MYTHIKIKSNTKYLKGTEYLKKAYQILEFLGGKKKFSS